MKFKIILRQGQFVSSGQVFELIRFWRVLV